MQEFQCGIHTEWKNMKLHGEHGPGEWNFKDIYKPPLSKKEKNKRKTRRLQDSNLRSQRNCLDR